MEKRVDKQPNTPERCGVLKIVSPRRKEEPSRIREILTTAERSLLTTTLQDAPTSVNPSSSLSPELSAIFATRVNKDGKAGMFGSPQKQGITKFKEVDIDIEDIGGDTVTEFNQIEAPMEVVVPLERFKKKGKLSVTDFSAQLWCEKQLEFTLITGFKRFTKAMKQGIERHAKLELADHAVVEVEVETKEDDLGLRLLNTVTLLDQLQETGKAREIWIFGCMDGVLIRGIIDELEIRKDESGQPRVVITDTKTRSQTTEPSMAQLQGTALQLELYRWLMNELRGGNFDFDFLFHAFRCDPRAAFNSEFMADYNNLHDLIFVFKQKIEELPPIEDYMEVAYECNSVEFARKKIPYSEISTLYTAHEFLEWWTGSRKAIQHVMLSERWKCKWCDFVGDCQVTPLTAEEVTSAVEKQRKDKEAENVQENKSENEKVEETDKLNANQSVAADATTSSASESEIIRAKSEALDSSECVAGSEDKTDDGLDINKQQQKENENPRIPSYNTAVKLNSDVVKVDSDEDDLIQEVQEQPELESTSYATEVIGRRGETLLQQQLRRLSPPGLNYSNLLGSELKSAKASTGNSGRLKRAAPVSPAHYIKSDTSLLCDTPQLQSSGRAASSSPQFSPICASNNLINCDAKSESERPNYSSPNLATSVAGTAQEQQNTSGKIKAKARPPIKKKVNVRAAAMDLRSWMVPKQPGGLGSNMPQGSSKPEATAALATLGDKGKQAVQQPPAQQQQQQKPSATSSRALPPTSTVKSNKSQTPKPPTRRCLSKDNKRLRTW